MFVSFTVLEGHALSKELAGGRARAASGEKPVAAVARRIAQDTRCQVVDLRPIPSAAPNGGDDSHYGLTLRGSLPHAGPGRHIAAEGVIRIKLLSGVQARGPRGADVVRVPAKSASESKSTDAHPHRIVRSMLLPPGPPTRR